LDQNFVEPTPPEEEITQPVRKRPAWVVFLWELLETIILAVVLYFLIDTVVGRVRVENVSMQPTLHEGQFLLVNKLAYRLGNYQRGDIVVFHHSETEDYIKRIIGLPGDTVRVENGIVYINDQAMDEPYIASPPAYANKWKVPEGHLFVLGDNRNQSSDSHSWGFVPDSKVIGRALVVYWPIQELKILNQVPVVNAAN